MRVLTCQRPTWMPGRVSFTENEPRSTWTRKGGVLSPWLGLGQTNQPREKGCCTHRLSADNIDLKMNTYSSVLSVMVGSWKISNVRRQFFEENPHFCTTSNRLKRKDQHTTTIEKSFAVPLSLSKTASRWHWWQFEWGRACTNPKAGFEFVWRQSACIDSTLEV